MNKYILVTGVNGFVGHHVANQLHKMNIKVLGVSNQKSVQDDLKEIVDEYISCDLTNPDEVRKLDLSNIEAIINLAAFAKIGGVTEEEKGLYDKINIAVHAVLYDECLNQKVSPRIIMVSTGAVYDPLQPLPLTEASSLAPDEKSNEYVISKKKAEKTISYFTDQGLKCVIARPFNHTGPGQLPGFLLPDLSQQIENALKEGQPLMVGNLDTKRDFTDVRDVARAYVELATCDESKLRHTVYNICSGSSISGKDMLQFVMNAYGASNMTTQIDPSRIRTNEIMEIYGSRERITQDIGWEPTISVRQMVEDFVEWKSQNNVEKN